MDPVTAFALAAKAIAEMIGKLVDGQTPEQKAQMWTWWVEDQTRWRRWLKLD